MKQIESFPQVPDRPDASHYGVQELNLFPRLTRAIYREKFGEQAPQYDPNRQIQRWFDTSPNVVNADPKTLVFYRVFDPDKGKIVDMTLPAGEARTPNLPGKYDWPKYVPAPTLARVRNSMTGSESEFNVNILAEKADADALAQEIAAVMGGEVKVQEQGFGGPWYFAWNGETRRVFNLVTPKGTFQVGGLLSRKYASGIGAPGRWEMSGSEPVWVPEQAVEVGEYDARPEVPIPVRDLLPGEILEQGFGGIWRVRYAPQSQTTEERLDRIESLLMTILRRME